MDRSPEPRTAVVVLAGGEGRRMGGSKPLRRFGDTPLIAHAVSLARAWSADVAVAVRSAEQVAGATDAVLLYDDATVEGPVAGLKSAFAFATGLGAAQVLTLPCDAPHLPADLLERLQAGLAGGLVSMASSDAVLQPVCALWRIEAAAALPAYLAAGRRSLHGFAKTCGATIVEWPAGELDPFADADTPEDLARLRPRS
jgi:molybdopterin-guanine dinucleotide biosynthesis protein A